jgi:hypothetical protein
MLQCKGFFTNFTKSITNFALNTGNIYSQPKMQSTLLDGSNLWLLKPTDYNRGKGINVFNRISTLKTQLDGFQKLEEQFNLKSSSSLRALQPFKNNIVKSHKFVVQKYIEKPLLFNERKFDIRVWALLDQDMTIFYFKEWYIRLSSEKFSLNDKDQENQYVHLTNNAIQKYSANYGKLESGNILSWLDLKVNTLNSPYLQELINKKTKGTFTKILEKIKELIKTCFLAVKSKINMNERRNCFEIFGFDFMLDVDLNVWVIEVNTNPSIDESNALLSKIIPRMIGNS